MPVKPGVGAYVIEPSASTVAVPFAGPLTTVGAPTVPRSLAAMSTLTGTPSVVVAASSPATGLTVTVTIPVSHKAGVWSSQPWTVKVSVPVNGPVGVYVKAPVSSIGADPVGRGDRHRHRHGLPGIRVADGHVPGRPGPSPSSRRSPSPTTGGWFGVAATSIVTVAVAQTVGETVLQIW